MPSTRTLAFLVRLRGKTIDTVHYSRNAKETIKDAIENVKRGLIDHDGYDSAITVSRRRCRS